MNSAQIFEPAVQLFWAYLGTYRRFPPPRMFHRCPLGFGGILPLRRGRVKHFAECAALETAEGGGHYPAAGMWRSRLGRDMNEKPGF